MAIEFGIDWFPWVEWVEDWRYYAGGYWIQHDDFADGCESIQEHFAHFAQAQLATI
jgi:hypothetical protein